MIRNVMVPFDGTAFSREAVLNALRIVSDSGATLHLVRVASSPVLLHSPDAFAGATSAYNAAQAAELSELYTLAAECRAHSTVSVRAALERGPVIDALLGYAGRHSIDLIVMRSHARQGIARVWFGSTAEALIRGSGIPVLVVRPPSVGTGLESGFHYRRILVPLDGSSLAEQALEPALDIARMEWGKITLLRVVTAWNTIPSNATASALGPASASEVREAQDYLASVARRIAGTGVAVVQRVVISHDVPGTILETAEADEIDLIALATRGNGMLKRAAYGSVADVVMKGSAISTLVTHPVRSAQQSELQRERNVVGAV